MKKLGTPIGAGPGRASESVGLPSAGWPSGCVRPASTFALSPWLPSPDEERTRAALPISGGHSCGAPIAVAALAPPLALLRALVLGLGAVLLLGALGLRCRLATAWDGGVARRVDDDVDRSGRSARRERRRGPRGRRRGIRGRGRRRVGGGLVGVVDRFTEVGVVEPADRRVVEARARIGGGAGIRARRGARAWVRGGDSGGGRVVDGPAEAALVQASGRCVVETGVRVRRGGCVVDCGASGGAGGGGRGIRAGGGGGLGAPARPLCEAPGERAGRPPKGRGGPVVHDVPLKALGMALGTPTH